MGFVKFTDTTKSFKPKVSIRSSGIMAFNSASVLKFGLRNTEYVLLFFDKDEKRIGIKPTHEEESGAHKLNKGKTGAWLAAQRFMDYFGISDKTTRRCNAYWDENQEMIVVQLPTPGQNT